ncbi:MAG: archease [Candidatus Aminicenantes bacterium]|nr:MAG: archease [Candidatus Aminicenantes bacterium]
MKKYETFSTTADVGLRIRGSGYQDLYQSAVKGLKVLLFEEPPSAPSCQPCKYPFEFHGDSPENVLVNLLSEIVFLLQDKNKITIDIKIKKVNDTYLKADLLTIPANRQAEMEIKSVTYHNLKINRKNHMLSTEVIFDI